MLSHNDYNLATQYGYFVAYRAVQPFQDLYPKKIVNISFLATLSVFLRSRRELDGVASLEIDFRTRPLGKIHPLAIHTSTNHAIKKFFLILYVLIKFNIMSFISCSHSSNRLSAAVAFRKFTLIG